MAEILKHNQGSFCWAELATSDPDAGKRFYAALFGWQAVDWPLPDGGVYTMFQVGGLDAAALYRQPLDLTARGVPPRWLSYLAVEDVDQMTREAARLGANVLEPSFDVADAGRMSILTDPGLAPFALWQPYRRIGARRALGPGGISWHELQTRNVDQALRFYTRLFGWKAERSELGDLTYYSYSKDGLMVAGMLELQRDWGPVPPQWTVYFGIDDVDAAVTRATGLGGRLSSGPTDFPGGRLAHLLDPQGAPFAIVRFAMAS